MRRAILLPTEPFLFKLTYNTLYKQNFGEEDEGMIIIEVVYVSVSARIVAAVGRTVDFSK